MEARTLDSRILVAIAAIAVVVAAVGVSMCGGADTSSPEAAVESPAAWADLLALETAVSRDPAFRALAPYVHVFAQLPPEDILSGL